MLASLLVTWVPCFLFIFLGAPYVERLRNNRHLAAALTGITAAVVAVIANLAVFFALHNLFSRSRAFSWGPVDLDVPIPGSWNPVAFAITAAALVLIFWRKWSTMPTLGVYAARGMLWALLG